MYLTESHYINITENLRMTISYAVASWYFFNEWSVDNFRTINNNVGQVVRNVYIYSAGN